MPFQPHQKSEKTPEELAQQREVRLRIRMANAYLKEGAVEKALGYMLSVLEMDNVAHKTRTRVAQSILANAGRMGDRGPQVTVDARSQQLTIADLARLAPGIGPMGLEVPNGGSPVSPALRPGDPAPTADLQDMHRLLELQFGTRSQVTPRHVDGSDADGLGLSGSRDLLRSPQTVEDSGEHADQQHKPSGRAPRVVGSRREAVDCEPW